MSLTGRVVKGFSWLVAGQAIQRISGLVITAALARLLMPEDFGLIALTTTAVGLVSILSEAGLTNALVQRLDIVEEHLTSAFWLSLAIGVTLALLGWAASPLIAKLYHEPRLVPLIGALMITLPLGSIGQVPDALLQRRLAFGRLAAVDCVGNIIAGVIGVVLAIQHAGVWALVAQRLALVLISACGRLVAARWLPRLFFHFRYVRDVLSFSASVMGCTLVNFAVNNVDNIIIGGALGVRALGYYALAYNLVMLPAMSVGGLIARVMFPVLSSLQDDIVRLRRGYLRMVHVVSSVTLPVIVGLGAVAPLFVTTIYGERWTPAIPILRVLVVIGIMQAVNTSALIFYALGRPNLLLACVVVSLVCMSLSFAVGVRWGLMGVAWAYVIVSPIVWGGPHVMANRLIALPNKSLVSAIAPSLCAATLMWGVISYASGHEFNSTLSPWATLVLMVCIGAAVYTGSYALIGTFLSRQQGGLIAWMTGQHLLEIDNGSSATI